MAADDFLVQVNIGPALELVGVMQERAADPTPVFLGPIKNSLDDFFTRQFDTSGAEGGLPWAPLSPATLASKARAHRGNMGILRFMNRLWASLVKPTAANEGISQVGVSGGTSAYVRGTAVQAEGGAPYAYFHQHGFTISRWGKAVFTNPRWVQPRVLIPPEMPPAYVEAWVRSLQRYVADGVVE